jgi:hypothetical protein
MVNMSNPKTVPSCSKPQVHNGWVRKSDLDAWLDRHLPVPTQVISNEEYLPIPQTTQQRRLEQEIVSNAERQARYLGVDRRQFLRTSCGMALAFAAMNTVFGRFFRVEAAEFLDPAAVADNKARFFIFDVQTHHVAMPNQAPHADQDFLKAVVGMRDMARKMNLALKTGKPESRMHTLRTTSKKFSSTVIPTWSRSAPYQVSRKKRMCSPRK